MDPINIVFIIGLSVISLNAIRNWIYWKKRAEDAETLLRFQNF